ncbi:MAG: hypothetical protein ACKVHE_35625, partial [Planctomycetales bacterium]
MWSAGDDDAGFRVHLRDADDLLHDLVAITLVENLIEAIEHQQRGTALQSLIQPLLIDSVALSFTEILNVIPKRIDFVFV